MDGYMREINAQKQTCLDCEAAALCWPADSSEGEVKKFDHIIHEKRMLQKGAFLFQAGEAFKYFYAIAAGSLKSYLLLADGREQIHSFYLRGEIVGFGAIDTGVHQTFAEALEPTQICVIPFETLLKTASHTPSLQRKIIHLMSHRIRINMNISYNSSATERVAAFLLSMTARITHNTTGDLTLPMSRADIANYLGLATETISRTLSALQHRDIIAIHGKHIVINDLTTLQQLACS